MLEHVRASARNLIRLRKTYADVRAYSVRASSMHTQVGSMTQRLPRNFGNYAVERVARGCIGVRRAPTNKLPYALWLPRLFGSDDAYADYWKTRTACVKRLLSRFGIGVGFTAGPTWDAALHFRCGDVPFDPHRVYRMPSPAFLRFVNRELHRRRILNASIHWTLSQTNNEAHGRKCRRMVRTITRQLTSVDARWVDEPDPHKTLQAFAAARTLISLVPSSFSFIVGVAAEDYVSPFLGLSGVEGARTLDVTNVTRARALARRVHWTMSTHQSLAPGRHVFSKSANA